MTLPALRPLLVIALLAVPLAAGAQSSQSSHLPTRHNEATVAELQAEMASGRLTSEELTKEYIQRIIAHDQNGPGVNAVIELDPDALDMARHADMLRRHGTVLGPLHGIPVLLKDNVDTGDKMQTTAGSFALFGMPALRDSTVAAHLRAGGAVILGKTNLSEWANSAHSSRSAGGRAAVDRPTTLMASIAILADPVRDRAPLHRQISRPFPLAPRPMAASYVPQMPTVWLASSRRLA